MKESLIEEKLEEKNMEHPKEVKHTAKKEEKAKDNGNLREKNKKTNKEKETNITKFKKSEEKPKKVEKEIEKMEDKKRKKWIIPVIAISVLIVMALVVSTIFSIANINNEKIISGISINGIEMSGLSKEEAKAKLDLMFNEKKEKEINIKYKEYESSLNPTLLEVKYDTEKAVNEAFLRGRNSNIFVNNYEILFSLIWKKDINIEMTLNEEVAKQTIEDIGVNIPGVIIESSYSIEDDKLIITKGKEGIYIDSEKLLNKVKENLNDLNASEDYIEIPVINKKPEEINIQKIHDEVYKEAQDAYYTKDPFTIYPEVEGIDFDIEEAKKIIEAEDKEEYVIKLTITKPKVTIDKIGTEAFPNQLATFTTRFDASDTNRTTNLVLACQKINGKVVLAGETFSYNKTLGPRTAAAGYKNAKIYEAGAVVDGLGGGICQISSTLYNSVLKANLEIVERRNHQFVTSYVPAGRDATVVYGMTDFKFKNTRKYPVRITASAKNGIATVSIYGIKEENEYTFSFSTKTVASIPFSTKYIEDKSLPTGTEKVRQKGANGIKTETYITKSLNGKVISTKLLSKDTYDAMTRIVLKGTATTQKTDKTPTPSNTVETPKTETPSTEKPKKEEVVEKDEEQKNDTNTNSNTNTNTIKEQNKQ